MADKQIKIWLSVFVFTLMAVGSAASYFAQGKTFYRGTERQQKTVNSDEFYASILNTDTENLEPAPELNFQAPENKALEDSVIPAEANVIPAQAGISPVSSPCAAGEKPIIKNGQISGCTSEQKKPEPVQLPAVKITAPSKPGPKVKIPPSPPPISQFPNFLISQYPSISCESQNLFTYTGPDRPGLLYGMCIECSTNTFIMNEGCALRAH